MDSYQDLIASFQEMIRIETIDTSVNDKINEIIKKIDKQISVIVKNKEDISYKFSLYFGLDTQRRILRKLVDRVSNATKIHENPKTASDALIIIPPLSVLDNSIENSIKTNTQSSSILSLASLVQMEAIKYNMYPSLDEMTEKINKKSLSDIVNSFAKCTEMIIDEK